MLQTDIDTLAAAAGQALAAGRLDDADRDAHALIEVAPTSALGHHLLAHVLVKRGQLEPALGRLRQASALEPANIRLIDDMAVLCQRLGRVAEASECHRRCSELEPGNGYFREMHTQSLLEQWIFAMEGRRIGREASKSYAAKVYSGFFAKYLSGPKVLDIGYRGGFGEAEPIVRQAVGIDLDYPGYDGVTLPFADGSQDAIYTSHCLEHMTTLTAVIQDWFRVLRVGGFAVVVVPHQFLYERRRALPSAHPGHLHFFTPASLLATFEAALPPNSYRVRHLMDNDLFYDYALQPPTHPVGCYEIELVLEKMAPPGWALG